MRVQCAFVDTPEVEKITDYIGSQKAYPEAYQLPEYKNTVIKRVLNVHKDIVSPYNTYKNLGLPPGLIAMPDISAIDAVLNFEKHQYLYFCADAKRLGFHKFAKTLSQHNANAIEYQRYLSSHGINK